MPTPRDQLPADATSLARRLAALERQVTELRASRRASYTTVQDGNLTVGAGGNILVEDGSVTAVSATGWKVILDPNDVDTPGAFRPVLEFKDPEGLVTATVNTSGITGVSGLASSSGTFVEDTRTDWRWADLLGQTDTGASRAMTVRLADTDNSVIIGGLTYLTSTQALTGLYDSTAGGFQARVQVSSGLIALSSGRATVTPPASASAGLSVSTASGHTGLVLLGQYNGGNVVTVDTAGNLAAAGQVTGQSLAIGSGTSSIGGNLALTGNATIGGAASKSGETWQTPSFAATWATTGTLNGNSTFHGLQYRKTAEDEVWLYGATVSTGTATTIFTLPSGYRPPTRAAVPAYFSSGSGTPQAGWAQVTETGAVAVNSGISGWSVASGTQVWLNGKFPLGNLS